MSPSDNVHFTSEAAQAVSRHDWERTIRRLRLANVVPASVRTGSDGRTTRGAVSGMTLKAVALTIASYSDADGTCVMPGNALLALDLETSLKTVKQARAALTRLGLLSRSEIPGQRVLYHLTCPAALLPADVGVPQGRRTLLHVREESGGTGVGWPTPAHLRLHWLADRDGGWWCWYCRVGLIDICRESDEIEVTPSGGRTVRAGCTKALPTVDHRIPRQLGGADGPSNQVLACQPCNSRKGAS